jgi:hypothetical protein
MGQMAEKNAIQTPIRKSYEDLALELEKVKAAYYELYAAHAALMIQKRWPMPRDR